MASRFQQVLAAGVAHLQVQDKTRSDTVSAPDENGFVTVNGNKFKVQPRGEDKKTKSAADGGARKKEKKPWI